ncbi:hypothetical protein [Streptomyces chryseus]|uniref:hypothetical protein n=1 Tax=Streptomyces chryseus TaxID=68186 RepID=UPI00110FD89F|nr:hypothetical protein [Streptomyces chryseus]GGX02266.1 hypothetical protein GCM10010353_17480 [Streptomyces chryseus]
MTPRERRRMLLGDDVIKHIHAEADAAPPPPPHLVTALRRIFTAPAGRPETTPASRQRDAA